MHNSNKNKKITIGLFNDAFYPTMDGVVMVVDNYARILSKYADVVVFAPSYNIEFDDPKLPYKVVRCSSIKVPFLDYSLSLPIFDKKFKSKLDKYNLDIVHIHSPFTIGLQGIKYAKKHNIPCVATMHSQFKQDFKRAVKSEFISTKLNNVLIKIFNKCDYCWAVNRGVATLFYEDYKYKKLPLVMDNATEMLPVSNEAKAHKYINSKYNIKPNEKVFLFVGRINILKNILFIVDALKLLKEKRPNFNFKMLFVGDGQDYNKLKNYIVKCGMEDKIIMCGKITDRSELVYYYSRADLFLFPSLYDASSIVQIESASQKTPTLFIQGSVTSSTVTDNVNGFLSSNSIDSYSNRIIDIFNNKELYNKVCLNAFKDLYKTLDDVVNNAYNLYLKYINYNKD